MITLNPDDPLYNKSIQEILKGTCPCNKHLCSCEDSGCWKISRQGNIPCKTCECHAIGMDQI